jgi:transcriptional regulator GlxA family with amidase domain
MPDHDPQADACRTVAMLIFPGGQSLDISGPLEVFAVASRQAQEDLGAGPLYRALLIGARPGPVRMACGMGLIADHGIDEIDGSGIDTLLVSGGMGDALDQLRAQREVVDWLRRTAAQVRRVGSICSGALMLAETGLLDGREATTHWLDVPELHQRYPQVRVLSDALYVRDGAVWTSAGVTAGMDLALAMVAADHSMPLALKTARRLVMATKRGGGQRQISEQLAAGYAPSAFASLADWLRENLAQRHSVEHLAERLHMSERQFRRRFVEIFSLPPMRYLEGLRVEAAKAQLEHSQAALKRVASDCGFASEDAMRRTFLRHCGQSPGEYRRRFAPPG